MKRIFIFGILVSLMTACGSDENGNARKYLVSAQQCYERGEFAEAKSLIDSVRIVYSKAFDARREGIDLLQKVEIAEAERTIAYHDSVISVLNERFEEVRRGFVYEKNEEYQDAGIYCKASQTADSNIGRNYIRAQVDEQGRLTLISNYSGSSYIHHRSLHLSLGDNYLDTPVSDDFYEFKDLGLCYERCNFADGKDGGAAAFIAMNKDRNIDVKLIGDRTVSMQMKASDRNAVAEVYSLSLLLKSIAEATAMRDEAKRKIQFVEANIARKDSLQ